MESGSFNSVGRLHLPRQKKNPCRTSLEKVAGSVFMPFSPDNCPALVEPLLKIGGAVANDAAGNFKEWQLAGVSPQSKCPRLNAENLGGGGIVQKFFRRWFW
jgi:hypothetical protein